MSIFKKKAVEKIPFNGIFLHGKMNYPQGANFFPSRMTGTELENLSQCFLFAPNGRPTSIMVTDYEKERCVSSSIASLKLTDKGYMEVVAKDGWSYNFIPTTDIEVYNMTMLCVLWNTSIPYEMFSMIKFIK